MDQPLTLPVTLGRGYSQAQVSVCCAIVIGSSPDRSTAKQSNMGGAPDTEEVDAFLEQVSEVSILIEGLKKGTISPEYVDKKQELKKEKAAAPKPPVTSFPVTCKPATGSDGSQAQQPEETSDHESAKEKEEARKERLMEKVQELQVNRERKLKARQKYEEYVQVGEQVCTQRPERQLRHDRAQTMLIKGFSGVMLPCHCHTLQANKSQAVGAYGTDYTKWDMWCPEDEEDDLFNSLTPNNPAFRAMERDIDDRHKRCVSSKGQRVMRLHVQAYVAPQSSWQCTPSYMLAHPGNGVPHDANACPPNDCTVELQDG